MSRVYKLNPPKKTSWSNKKMSLTTLIVVTGVRNCSGSDCVGYLGLQGVHHIVAMATINHYNSHPILGGVEGRHMLELVLWNR